MPLRHSEVGISGIGTEPLLVPVADDDDDDDDDDNNDSGGTDPCTMMGTAWIFPSSVLSDFQVFLFFIFFIIK